MTDLLARLLTQPEPEGSTDEDRIKAAFVIGQTGAPSSETERLAFESWMRGHSWLVEGVWNGTTYDDRGPSRVSSVDVGAMQTRMLWAAWRDRAALARWGRPIPPEPEGPIPEAELAAMWNQQADAFNQWESLDVGEQLAWAQARALARYARPAIKPVPVNDSRLPELQ